MPVSYLEPYNMDWLAYLDPADVPPNPYAICVVDTGVAITPDTPADNPAGPIVKRYAFDGGTGEPQTTNAFGLHGTRMAMAASAPPNDWGTVGAWPGARIISMRATKEQEQFIRTRWYQQAALECAEEPRIAAVLWSLGCAECEPTADEAFLIRDAISFAHARKVSVVAATGNESGEPNYPADQVGVFSVAAGSAMGGLCADSAYAQGVSIIGPGCPVQTGDPLTGVPQAFDNGGTSTASAVAGTLIAALRSLRPEIGYRQTEEWVEQSAGLVDGRPVLDGEGAARLAGAGAIVDRALARMPEPPVTPSPTATPVASATPTARPPHVSEGVVLARLAAPHRDRLTVRQRGRTLLVRVTDRPLRARLEVLTKRMRESKPRDAIVMRTSREIRWVDLRYLPSPANLDQPSSVLHLRRVSGGRFR